MLMFCCYVAARESSIARAFPGQYTAQFSGGTFAKHEFGDIKYQQLKGSVVTCRLLAH